MLNSQSIEQLVNAQWKGARVKPQYSNYSFARISPTVSNILSPTESLANKILPDDVFGDQPRSFDHVILFVIDAFGWHLMESLLDSSDDLRFVFNQGYTSKLSAMFPSTTTASLSTLYTGRPPYETGMLEWSYYDHRLDLTICPLLNSLSKDAFGPHRQNNTLTANKVQLSTILPANTYYSELKRKGVHPYVVCPQKYASSEFSKLTFSGANVIPYLSIEDGFTNLARLSQGRAESSTFITFYFALIDTLSHQFGPYSPETKECALTLFSAIRQFMFGEKPKRNTLFIITADHGQTSVDPQKVIWLDKAVPGIASLIRKNKKGELLGPCGSVRDLFLYVEKNQLDTAYSTLQDAIGSLALVERTSDLLKLGFFGDGTPSNVFLGNLPDLVILPDPGKSIFWLGDGRYNENLKGAHGGLSAEEMEVPFIMISNT